jgi:hypothetical protein
MDIVLQIIKHNKYETQTLNKICNKREKQEQDNRKKRWARFTYMGKETRFIKKLFKNTDVKIPYTMNNNLGKLLATRTDQNLDKYKRNGVYQLECPSCNKKYIGQTRYPFRVRFREHYNDYKYRHNKSKFAQHVIDEGHSFGPMNEIMEMTHVAKKGRMLNTLEKFYIYRETKHGNQITENLTRQPNPIFEALL